MKMIKAPGQALFLLWLLLIMSCKVQAAVPVPQLTGHIMDQTATLTINQQTALELMLRAFETKKGSQIVVLIVPTTEPEVIEQYAIRVAEDWRIGRKKIDDGVILIVAKNDRTLRIEVGYGLEGALTDITSKRIISEIITPYFKQGDFNGGISAGVDQIMRVIDGEALPEPVNGNSNISFSGSKGFQQFFPVILIAAIVVGGLLRALLGKFFGSIVTGGIIAFIAWIFVGALGVALIAGLLALLFTFFGGGSGGIGGGRGWGGGGFGGGGFGSGGFGGGGGGFGGGGASGRW